MASLLTLRVVFITGELILNPLIAHLSATTKCTIADQWETRPGPGPGPDRCTNQGGESEKLISGNP